jgi:uncharacterized damage-inducible protein DinB
MSAQKQLQMLARYKAWANNLMHHSLSVLPESELVAKRQIVFGNILRTLNHVYLMDSVWKAHLEGVPHNITTRNPETSPPFTELLEAQQHIDTWYVEYADTLRNKLYDKISFTFIGGGTGAMTRGDILLHVANHATYHRGHIAAMIYMIQAQPPTTDLPVFLRKSALMP